MFAVADDGTPIFFERFSPTTGPNGAPPVLLVMGLGANGRLWAPAIRRYLASGYDVITVDNRGCGRSGTPWRPWTTRTMATDAVAVMDELEIERAHIGGGSLGGMIAQEIALEFPERAETLVLASTTGGLPRLDLMPQRGCSRSSERCCGRGGRPAIQSSGSGSTSAWPRRTSSRRTARQETRRGPPSHRCSR